MIFKQKIIKIFAYILVVMLLIIGFIISKWIFEFKSKIPIIMSEENIQTKDVTDKIYFEEGGRIEKEIFNTLLLFSKKDNNINNSISIKKKYIYIKRSFILNLSIKNSCRDFKCLRIKKKFKYISANAWKALMAIEDVRFIFHKGIDLKSLVRAVVVDIASMRYKQGGSTLTQQLVKNLFLKSEKSLQRKFKEFIWAISLEHYFSKQQIISMYLNYVYWGTFQSINIKGIEAASLFYFQKHADKISEFESAILICLLKGPSYYSPVKHIDRLKRRVETMFKILHKKKIFPNTSAWNNQKWNNWHSKLVQFNNQSNFKNLYFSLNAKHLDQKNKIESNINQDFSILDYLVVSKSGNALLKKLEKKFNEKIFSYKILITSLKNNSFTNGVFNFKNTLHMYSRLERKQEIALSKERHTVGSILKPLLYSILVESFGIHMSDEILTDKVILHLKSGKWSPRESHKNLRPKVNLIYALQHSLNRPIVKLINRVGFDKFEVELLKYIPNLKLPLREYPAQLLGSIELSLSEILQIYRKLFLKCSFNTSIKEVLSVLTFPQKTTISHRVGNILREYHFFGKTGTSNSGRNNWFLFSYGNSLGVIWLGRESKGKLQEYNMFGSNTSFLIFKDYIINRGKPISEFVCH